MVVVSSIIWNLSGAVWQFTALTRKHRVWPLSVVSARHIYSISDVMLHRCASICTWYCALALWVTSSVSGLASSQHWSTVLPLTGSTPGQQRLWSVWPLAFWWTSLPLSQIPGRTLPTIWHLLTNLWQKPPACTLRASGVTTTPHQRSDVFAGCTIKILTAVAAQCHVLVCSVASCQINKVVDGDYDVSSPGIAFVLKAFGLQSYLELISLYKDLLACKREELRLDKERLENGVTKIAQASAQASQISYRNV